MVTVEQVAKKYQDVCLQKGGMLCLVMGDPASREVNAVKFVSSDDDLGAIMAVAKDIGHACLSVIELESRESAFLAVVSSSNMRKLEAIGNKLVAAVSNLK